MCNEKIPTNEEVEMLQDKYQSMLDGMLFKGVDANGVKAFKKCYNALNIDGVNAVLGFFEHYYEDTTKTIEIATVISLCCSLSNNPKYCQTADTPRYNIVEDYLKINIPDEAIDEIAPFVSRYIKCSDETKKQIQEYVRKIAEEGLIGKCLPIYLPCEVGDTVYIIREISKGNTKVEAAKVDCFHIGNRGVLLADICTDSGNRFTSCERSKYFLTREEAEFFSLNNPNWHDG